MILFEVVDRSGRKIRLTDERWRHIAREHPAVASRIEYVMATLTSPLTVRKSPNDSAAYLYYRYYKDIPVDGKYLLVVVKHLNGDGFIVTSYFTNKILGDI